MRKFRGFTLVELVIGMTVGAAIALVAFVLFTPAQSWLFTQSRRTAMNEGQAAVARTTREISMIGSPAEIISFLPQMLQFTDVNGDTVTIQLTGTNLMLGNDVLAENISALSFTYLDKDGNVVAQNSNIRVINVWLEITAGSQTIRLQSGERIRNAP